ncbi:MAG: hypothetical protein LBT20_04035 [Clostridiales bacterium]|jgi:hypothetical protein|nr:hypothetical protein [Clostridiales bacterium]
MAHETIIIEQLENWLQHTDRYSLCEDELAAVLRYILRPEINAFMNGSQHEVEEKVKRAIRYLNENDYYSAKTEVQETVSIIKISIHKNDSQSYDCSSSTSDGILGWIYRKMFK